MRMCVMYDSATICRYQRGKGSLVQVEAAMRLTLSVLVELGEAALNHAAFLILEALGTGHCVVGRRLALGQRGLPASGVMHGRVGRVARLRAIHAVDVTI